MRYQRKGRAPSAKADMTPMIDIVFQLIAFFMLLVNFSEIEQNQAINLPSSELVEPVEGPPESIITLQLTAKGKVFFRANETTIDGLGRLLRREVTQIQDSPDRTVKDTNVIIRADKNAQTGNVQKIIAMCQEENFIKFTLRAKEQKGT